MAKKRVGIFAGSFDPVHEGHISVARQALSACNLDVVIFMVEEKPWTDKEPADLVHRRAMLDLALAGNSAYKQLQLSDTRFTLDQTLPKIEDTCKDDELVFLLGSDVLMNMNAARWPGLDSLLKYELIVFLRSGDTREQVLSHARQIAANITVIDSALPNHRSTDVRLRFETHDLWVPKSVAGYIQDHQLYKEL